MRKPQALPFAAHIRLSLPLALAIVAVTLGASRSAMAQQGQPARPGGNRPVSPQVNSAEVPRYIREANERQAAEIQQHESELNKLLREPKRWTSIPAFVEHVISDPSGRVWFSARMRHTSDEAGFFGSVERAAAGQTHVVHGGTVHFVDRAGRVWACSDAKPGLLRCYDSRQKKWGETRSATGEQKLPGDAAEQESSNGWFREAWEDSVGNLYFVSEASPLGMGVTRRSRDGKWTFDLLEPKGTSADGFLDGGAWFHEQAGGRVTITPRTPYGAVSREDEVVHYFNGTKWARLAPHVCKHHDLYWAVPMLDGSMVTVCSGNGVWTYWPPDLLPKRIKEADKLISQLADADLRERERAVTALIAVGPHMLPTLRERMNKDASPEVRLRLRDVIRAVECLSKPDHDGVALAGRFESRGLYFISKPAPDRVRLYVDRCKDRRTGKALERAFIVLGSDGTLELAETPIGQWRQAGFQSMPENCLEDAAGGIWLPGGLRVDTRKGNRVVSAAPQGVRVQEAKFADKEGRAYLSDGSQYVLYDPIAPDGKGDLPQQIIAGQAIHLVHGQAWAVNLVHVPITMERLDKPTQPVRLPFEQMDATAFAVLPLEGALLAQAYSGSIAMGNRTMLWDGQEWSGPAPLMELIKPKAEFFARAAGEDFAAVGPEHDMRLAGDGKGSLWVAEELWEVANGGAFPGQAAPPAEGLPNQEYARRFEYYDGLAWHDVWAELKQQDPSYTGQILRAVDGGKSVLIQTQRRPYAILLASFDGQQVRATKVAEFDDRSTTAFAVRWENGPNGEVWIEPGRPPFQLLRYKDGAITTQPLKGRLLLGDSKGRVWRGDGGKLHAKIGDTWVSAPVAGLTLGASAMVEAPDGRLWLLYPEGLSQIGVQGSGGKAAIRELGRWKWDTTKSEFRKVFCDSRGGLWLCTDGTRHTRYMLPRPKPTSAPSNAGAPEAAKAIPARSPPQ